MDSTFDFFYFQQKFFLNKKISEYLSSFHFKNKVSKII
jgi:hypothetical protein